MTINDTEEICFHLCPEFGQAGIFGWTNIAIARIVGNHIQTPEGLHCFSNGAGRRLLAYLTQTSFGLNARRRVAK